MKAMRDKTGVSELHLKLGITYYGRGKYEKAIKHLKEGLALAEEIGDKCYEGKAFQNIGMCYLSLGEYDRAMSSLQEGLKIAKEIGNQSDAGQAYQNIGACYKSLCRYNEAILHSKWGLEIAQEIGDKSSEGAAYQNLGVCYSSLGQYNNAISHLQKSLKIAEEIGDNRVEEAAYIALGACYRSLAQYEKAISYSQQSLEIANEIGDKRGERSAYQNLGACYRSLGQYDKAISYLQGSLKIAKEIGDKRGEGLAYQNLGVCYQSLGEYDNAISHLQESLKIANEIGDKRAEGAAYHLGACYQSLGEYDNAISHFQEALEIAKGIGNESGEGAAYLNLGVCYRSLGQFDNAISRLQRGVEIAKEIGEKSIEGAAYRNLGVCYQSIVQYDNAISSLQRSMEIAKEIGEKSIEGRASGDLGVCYQSIGQYDNAILPLEDCMKIAKEIGDKRGERSACNNLGACYQTLGRYDNAISHVQKGLEIAKEIGDKRGEGLAYQNLGVCYQYLGQYNNAISHIKEGLKIAKEIGSKSVMGAANQSLGVCYQSLGQYDNAISHLQQGLEIAKEIGDKSDEGAAYQNLGLCYQSLGRYDNAISRLEEGLKIAREIGSKSGEGPAHLNIGACYQCLGQFDKAIYHLQRSLNVAKSVGDKRREGVAYHYLGTTYKSIQDTENAEHMLRNSVECFIELFNNAPNVDAARVSFRDTFLDTSDELIDSLVCQAKTDEALIVAEECRAMSLKYLMNSGNFIPNSSHLGQLNLQQIREMRKSLDRGGVIYFALPNSRIYTWTFHENGQIRLLKTTVGEELDKKEEEGEETVHSSKILVDHLMKLASLGVELGCDDSSLAEEETTGAKLQRIFQANARFALRIIVEILLALLKLESKPGSCDDRSLSFLHPEVSRPTEKEHESVPPQLEIFPSHIPSRSATAQRSPISPGAQGLQKQGTPAIEIHQRNRETRTEISGTEQLMHVLLAFLYKLLLYPVRQHIAGSQVVIVPDGPLALVPFAALVDENGRYVAESGARIRLVPSLAAGHIIRKRPRNPIRTALIIGDPHVNKILKDGKIIPVPRIPSAVKEAKLIGRVLRCKPLTGREATKEEFLRNVESADLIHIAAHGDAERGEILFAAPSGTGEDQTVPVDEVMLKMSDLETKRIRAQLVVLSSCYSARGKVQGEGVVGMARAFLGAGARAVLVALWAVDDDVTYPMIGIFYEGLLHGKSASEALSDAMKVVRESQDRFCDPRFWAPFILLGDDVSPLGVEGCNIHTIRS